MCSLPERLEPQHGHCQWPDLRWGHSTNLSGPNGASPSRLRPDKSILKSELWNRPGVGIIFPTSARASMCLTVHFCWQLLLLAIIRRDPKVKEL